MAGHLFSPAGAEYVDGRRYSLCSCGRRRRGHAAAPDPPPAPDPRGADLLGLARQVEQALTLPAGVLPGKVWAAAVVLRAALRVELGHAAAATPAPAPARGQAEIAHGGRADPGPASLLRRIESRELRAAARAALEQGWAWGLTSRGHVRLVGPDGQVVVIATHAGDPRGAHNARATLKRLGVRF